MPTVLIVDDDDDIRFLIRWMIEETSGWYVAGEAASAEQAVSRWLDLRPDVVIIDQLLGGSTGLEAAERMLAEEPRQRIVLFSMTGGVEIEREATALGVARCVSKAKLQDLPAALAELFARPQS